MGRAAAPAHRAARGLLRADAADNRRRLVDAARAVFAERGIDAPLDEIARRAGVGNATLYRRFPTRDALVAAAFEDRLAEYAGAAAEALRAPDPWAGFCGYVERVCAMQAADRGARDVLTMTFPTARGLEAQRARAYRDFAELVRRAQAEGQLRADFVAEDLVLLLMANAGVVRGAGRPPHWPGSGSWGSCSMGAALRAPTRCRPRRRPPGSTAPCAGWSRPRST